MESYLAVMGSRDPFLQYWYFWRPKNDYRKTYIASYQESNATRLRIADSFCGKLPMSFFNTKDLSELTTSHDGRTAAVWNPCSAVRSPH